MKKDKVSESDVEYLAELSRLKFDDNEFASMHKEVSNVVSLLNGCEDCSDASCRSGQSLTIGELRDDTSVGESLSQESVFVDKDCDNGYFVLPRVVE